MTIVSLPRSPGTVVPCYNAPRYYADSDIMRSVVDPEFLPPGENVKWYLELL